MASPTAESFPDAVLRDLMEAVRGTPEDDAARQAVEAVARTVRYAGRWTDYALDTMLPNAQWRVEALDTER